MVSEGRFQIITSREELDFLLPEWRDLHSRWEEESASVYPPPFLRPDVWVAGARTGMRPGDQLCVFARRSGEDGVLEAVFPGFLRENQIRLLNDEWVDYQDMTARNPESACRLFEDIVAFAEQNGHGIALRNIADQSWLRGCVLTAGQTGLRMISRVFGPCPFNEVQIESGKTYLDTFSSSRRRKHREKASRLHRALPDSRIAHFREGQITGELIERMGVLHQKNQYRKKGESIFRKEEFREWLKELTRVNSGFTASVVFDGDTLAAFSLSFTDDRGRASYMYIPSYGEEYAHLSIGSYLMIESAVEAGPIEGGSYRFDLLCGDEAYKALWETDRYFIYRVRIFPHSVRGLIRYNVFRIVYELKWWKKSLRRWRSSPE